MFLWFQAGEGARDPRSTGHEHHPDRSERLWTEKAPAAEPHRRAISAIIGIAGAGLPMIVWGVVSTQVWPTVFGWTLVFISQLWQIDRFVAIYDSAVRVEAPRS